MLSQSSSYSPSPSVPQTSRERMPSIQMRVIKSLWDAGATVLTLEYVGVRFMIFHSLPVLSI